MYLTSAADPLSQALFHLVTDLANMFTAHTKSALTRLAC